MSIDELEDILAANIKNYNVEIDEKTLREELYKAQEELDNENWDNIVFESTDKNLPIFELAKKSILSTLISDIYNALKIKPTKQKSNSYYDAVLNYQIKNSVADKLKKPDRTPEENTEYITPSKLESVSYGTPKMTSDDWMYQAVINNFKYIGYEDGSSSVWPLYTLSTAIEEYGDDIMGKLEELGYDTKKANAILVNLIPFIRKTALTCAQAVEDYNKLPDDEKGGVKALDVDNGGRVQNVIASALFGLPLIGESSEGMQTVLKAMANVTQSIDTYLSGKGIDLENFPGEDYNIEILENANADLGDSVFINARSMKMSRTTKTGIGKNPFVEKLLSAPPSMFSNMFDTFIEIVPKNYSFKEAKTNYNDVKDIVDLVNKKYDLFKNPLVLSCRIESIDLPFKNALTEINDIKMFGTGLVKSDNTRDRDTKSKLSLRADSKLYINDVFDSLSGTNHFLKNISLGKKFPFQENTYLQDISRIFPPRNYKINIYVKKVDFGATSETWDAVNSQIENSDSFKESTEITNKNLKQENSRVQGGQYGSYASSQKMKQQQNELNSLKSKYTNAYNKSSQSSEDYYKKREKQVTNMEEARDLYANYFRRHMEICNDAQRILPELEFKKIEDIENKNFSNDSLMVGDKIPNDVTSKLIKANEKSNKEIEALKEKNKKLNDLLEEDYKICKKVLDAERSGSYEEFMKAVNENIKKLKYRDQDFSSLYKTIIDGKIKQAQEKFSRDKRKKSSYKKNMDQFNLDAVEGEIDSLETGLEDTIDLYNKSQEMIAEAMTEISTLKSNLENNIAGIVEKATQPLTRFYSGFLASGKCSLFTFEDCRFLGTTDAIEFNQDASEKAFSYEFIFKRFIEDTVELEGKELLDKINKGLK